ncbi:MAG: OmpA family protein [Bacteroidota bacterium]
MKNLVSVIILLVMPFTMSVGQNLLLNPGFEQHSKCPDDLTTKYRSEVVDHWYSANEGTPDYFNKCSKEAGIPYNWAGNAEAAEGRAYTGIITYLKGSEYREYIQGELGEPLKPKTHYRISFKFRLANNCGFVSDALGVLLTNNKIKFLKANRIEVEPTLSLTRENALQPQTGGWEEFDMDYRAKGGEQFITVGNFISNEKLKTYQLKSRKTRHHMLSIAAYYYLDDISITEVKQQALALKYESDSIYHLEKIHFGFDSAEIRITDELELRELVAYLKNHQKYSLVLIGHADERGSAAYNLELSLSRAKAVKSFLVTKGISRDRIEVVGRGEKMPLSFGKDEASRSSNRRVAFKLVSKK